MARREIKNAQALDKLGVNKYRRDGKWHIWTQQDDDYIRVNYKQTDESADAIAAVLKVGPHQVKIRAYAMGIGKKSLRGQKRFWTPEEDAQLRAMVHKYSINTISNKLNRSQNAIHVRSVRLKLILRSHDGWYTKKDCCEILGEDHKWLEVFINSGELKASYHNGKKPQKNGMAMWHIETKDFRGFILSHLHLINGRNVNLIKLIAIVRGNGHTKAS